MMMAADPRTVLAKYMEEPEEHSYDEARPWMDYLKEKQKGTSSDVNTVEKMLKDIPGEGGELDDPICQYNPYDYSDPSSKPKDMKDSPPFVNVIHKDIDYPTFMVPPHVFGPDGPHLKEWKDVSRRDFTQDEDVDEHVMEDEQQPAISLTRKKASIGRVVGQYLMSDHGVLIPRFGDLTSHVQEMERSAASLQEIVNLDRHYKSPFKAERAKGLSGRIVWENQSNKDETNKGFFVFRVYGESGVYAVYFQFLKNDQAQQNPYYINFPVEMACTCPSFLYYGAQWYAIMGKYMYNPAIRPDKVPPREPTAWTLHVSPRYPKGKKHPGRGLNFRVCKHILACFDKMRTWKIEAADYAFPEVGAPPKIINKDEWLKLMGFEFNEESIRKALNPPVRIPDFYETEEITQEVMDWFTNVWDRMPEEGKIKIMRNMVVHPERIFYLLLKEAYRRQEEGKRISERMIHEGYELMSRVIKPESEESPKQVEQEGVPPEDRGTGRGTGAFIPGGGYNAKDWIEGKKTPTVPKEPPTVDETKKKRRSWRETLDERVEKRKKEREKRFGPGVRSIIRKPRETISPLNVVKRFQEMCS